MKYKFLFGTLLAVTLLGLSLALSKPLGAAAPPEGSSKQAAPINRAKVDITIDDAGNITVGGIDLASLGLAPIDPQVATMAKNLGSVNIQVQDETVSVAVQDTEIARLLWNASSREAVASLAANYGVQLDPGVQARVEEWVSSSDIDVTARYTNEGSHAVELSLSKPIVIDIAANGQLAIERGPLAAGIDPNVVQQIRLGGSHALACWSEGTLTASVDGVELPTLVLNPAGVDIIAQALNLPINRVGTDALLNARVGVDLSLPGGSHASDTACAG